MSFATALIDTCALAYMHAQDPDWTPSIDAAFKTMAKRGAVVQRTSAVCCQEFLVVAKSAKEEAELLAALIAMVGEEAFDVTREVSVLAARLAAPHLPSKLSLDTHPLSGEPLSKADRKFLATLCHRDAMIMATCIINKVDFLVTGDGGFATRWAKDFSGDILLVKKTAAIATTTAEAEQLSLPAVQSPGKPTAAKIVASVDTAAKPPPNSGVAEPSLQVDGVMAPEATVDAAATREVAIEPKAKTETAAEPSPSKPGVAKSVADVELPSEGTSDDPA